MTQQELIDIFLHDLIEALLEVDDVYYGLPYWSGTATAINNYDVPIRVRMRRYLDRYHERVFCYELYHKVRARMEAKVSADGQNVFAPGRIFLQSEVVKYQIDEIIETSFNALRLSRDFMPDFLLHTPGDFSNQLAIVEAKSSPHLNARDFRYDLRKLEEFIVRYHYQIGVFVGVNLPENKRVDLIRDVNQWARRLEVHGRILLILISGPGAIPYIRTLQEICDEF